MRVTMATEPAKPGHPNEDFVGATPAGVVLLDGAGAGDLSTGCIHGVAWYAHQLGGQLLARISNEHQDLTAVLAEAIDATAAQHRSTCDPAHPGTPSATAVLLRRSDERVQHIVLVNSVFVVRHRGGNVETISDDREAPVDNRYRSLVDTTPNGTPEPTTPSAPTSKHSDNIATSQTASGSLPQTRPPPRRI